MSSEKDSNFHQERISLLSSSSGFENYRGFLNLLYVIFAIGSCRLVLDNILQYGLLIEFDWPIRFVRDPTNWPSVRSEKKNRSKKSRIFVDQLFLIVLVNFFIFAQLFIERRLINPKRFSRFWKFGSRLNIFLLLTFPVFYIGKRKPNPIGAFAAVLIYSIVCLKLISFSQVNAGLRQILNSKKNDAKKTGAEQFIQYPNNLTLKNIYYFIFAPTLCYELNFPRSTNIRKGFVLRRFAEILVVFSLQYCLGQQWILPILSQIDRPLFDYSLLENIERLLRLSLPNHLLWLSVFYVYFHSILNLIAEILGFADRLFYRDWWNATDLKEFWNRWNIIVHQFAKRHIFRPLVKEFGFRKSTAAVIVFLVSAFFHEYLISVPLRMIRPWSFLAMILQVPIGFVVQVMKQSSETYGNISVWISLILIQPIALLLYIQDLYYRDFVPQRI